MTSSNKKPPAKKNRSRIAAVLFAVLLAVLLAVSGILLWLGGHFLPRWISWHEKTLPLTTYEPHPIYPYPGFVPVETGSATLELRKRKIQIVESASETTDEGTSAAAKAANKETAADTEPVSSGSTVNTAGWYISDAAVEDINNDGIEEILLLCWKRGHYSGAKPFWESRDEIGFSQHLYIFHYQEGTLVPIWMSSYMPFNVLEMTVDSAGVHLLSTEGEDTLWVWEHWGLKLRETN